MLTLFFYFLHTLYSIQKEKSHMNNVLGFDYSHKKLSSFHSDSLFKSTREKAPGGLNIHDSHISMQYNILYKKAPI